MNLGVRMATRQSCMASPEQPCLVNHSPSLKRNSLRISEKVIGLPGNTPTPSSVTFSTSMVDCQNSMSDFLFVAIRQACSKRYMYIGQTQANTSSCSLGRISTLLLKRGEPRNAFNKSKSSLCVTVGHS